MTRIPSALFIGLILSVFAIGQTPTVIPTPPDNSDVVQITTNLIQLDAIVTGKGKKQVTNLKAEDFEIFENGKKREISFFSYVSLVAPAEADESETSSSNKKKAKNEVVIPTSRLQVKEVRRAYAIVVDDLGIAFENMPALKRALRKFVNEDVAQGDLVAIVRTGRGSGALQSFTSDKRQLLAAVEKIRWNAYGRSGVTSFDPIRTTLKEDLANSVDSSGGVSSPAGVESDREFVKQSEAERRSNFEAGTIGALRWIIEGMNKLTGRKSIVLFSEGFSTVSTDGFSSNRTELQLRRLTEYANRSSVTFYTIDPRGLVVPGFATAADDIREVVPVDPLISLTPGLDDRNGYLRDSQSSLRYLAYETGGVPFVNNNSLTKGLDRAMEDQKGYYLIAYEPDEETFDSSNIPYNKIEIKVKVEGLKVRSRNGFYAIPDKPSEKRAETAQRQIYGAITSPFESGDISLTLSTVFSKGPDAENFIQSLVFLDGKDLHFETMKDGTRKANFDILAITFGDSNVPYDEVARNYTITLGENNFQDSIDKGFVYRLNVPMKKHGAYQFRIAVRDSVSKKVGSASQFVSVPNLKKKRLALSGIVVDRYSTAEWRQLKTGNALKGGSEYQNSIDNARRQFRVGDVLRFGYEIYNAKSKRSYSLRTRLISEGKVLAEGSPSPLDRTIAKDRTRIQAFGAITLGKNLVPGNYVLQVIVSEDKSKKRSASATQWIEFEVIG